MDGRMQTTTSTTDAAAQACYERYAERYAQAGEGTLPEWNKLANGVRERWRAALAPHVAIVGELQALREDLAAERDWNRRQRDREDTAWFKLTALEIATETLTATLPDVAVVTNLPPNFTRALTTLDQALRQVGAHEPAGPQRLAGEPDATQWNTLAAALRVRAAELGGPVADVLLAGAHFFDAAAAVARELPDARPLLDAFRLASPGASERSSA